MSPLRVGRPMVEDFVISRTFKCAARPGLEVLHRSRAYEGVVGSERLQGNCVQNGSAAWRQLSLRPAISNGQPIWGKLVYREIVPPERLVLINSFSNEKAARHATQDTKLALANAFQHSPSRICLAARRSSPSDGPLQRDGGGGKDLRLKPHQHDARLERHFRAARSVSGESHVARAGTGRGS